MGTISITLDFPQPVSKVFAYLSQHENLGEVFGIAVQRIKTSDDPQEPNGLGSVRRLKVGPVAFEETITGFEKDRRIEYRITKGAFMKHHLGVMRFSEHQGGTRLDYTIEVESKIPLLTGPLVMGLNRDLRKGLKAVARRLT
jgi:uncharacterized protein YndB with AHSA1/START domain